MWLFMQSCSFAAAPMRSGPLFSTRLRISSALYALMASSEIQSREKHSQAKNWKREVRTQMFFSGERARGASLSPKNERASQTSAYAWHRIP